jgi:hypothetical protein
MLKKKKILLLFIFDFYGFEKVLPPLFLSPLLVAIIDIFQWYQKTFWAIVKKYQLEKVTFIVKIVANLFFLGVSANDFGFCVREGF